VSPLVVTCSLGKARNKVLVQDLVQKQNVELWPCEFVWLKKLLRELQFGDATQVTLVCDNQVALHISSNLVFHERTKHIEINCHFILEKIVSRDLFVMWVPNILNQFYEN